MAVGTYSDSSTQNLTNSVAWNSSDTTVAMVSSTSPTSGLAKALANGNAIITATSAIVSGTAVLTVTSASAVSIVVTPTNATLPLGLRLTQQFSANATFSDGTTQDMTGTASWKSSSSSIASITTSGLATAKNVGSTNISATFGSVSNNIPLTVNAANLNFISIQPSNGSITQGTPDSARSHWNIQRRWDTRHYTPGQLVSVRPNHRGDWGE